MLNKFEAGEKALLDVRVISKSGDYCKVRINSSESPAIVATVHYMELTPVCEKDATIQNMEQVGIIPHTYVNANDNPGAYAADLCERQAVTVRFACDNLTDLPVWFYSKDADDMGMDPWVQLQGIGQYVRDQNGNKTNDSFYIEYGRIGEKRVHADFIVYAQRRDLSSLGFPPGSPPSLMRTR